MDDTVLILRMVERMIAVLIGGVSIYLGYRLFFHLPFDRSDKGELELPGIKVVLSRVGPGVFFAAFGSLVLYYSYTEGVELEQLAVTSMSDSRSEGADTGESDLLKTETSFSGASNLPSSPTPALDGGITPQQRSSALKSIQVLNCAERLVSREAAAADLEDQIVISIRDAKISLLRSVWNTDKWGSPTQLGVAGPAASAPSQVRTLFSETYADCPK